MWIDQSYRGKGYGSQLLGEIEQIAKIKGVPLYNSTHLLFRHPVFMKSRGMSTGKLEVIL